MGLQGTSYAIPTKGDDMKPLPLEEIRGYVNEFLKFARTHPGMTFQVTAIGCGLAKYRPDQIAPMFRDAPANCTLPNEFYLVLMEG